MDWYFGFLLKKNFRCCTTITSAPVLVRHFWVPCPEAGCNVRAPCCLEKSTLIIFFFREKPFYYNYTSASSCFPFVVLVICLDQIAVPHPWDSLFLGISFMCASQSLVRLWLMMEGGRKMDLFVSIMVRCGMVGGAGRSENPCISLGFLNWLYTCILHEILLLVSSLTHLPHQLSSYVALYKYCLYIIAYLNWESP